MGDPDVSADPLTFLLGLAFGAILVLIIGLARRDNPRW